MIERTASNVGALDLVTAAPCKAYIINLFLSKKKERGRRCPEKPAATPFSRCEESGLVLPLSCKAQQLVPCGAGSWIALKPPTVVPRAVNLLPIDRVILGRSRVRPPPGSILFHLPKHKKTRRALRVHLPCSSST
jgi:hypothetical protein